MERARVLFWTISQMRKRALLFLDEPNRLAEALEEVEQEVEKSREKREEQEMHLDQELKEMIPTKEIYRRINQFYSVGFATLETRCKEFRVRGIYPLDVRRSQSCITAVSDADQRSETSETGKIPGRTFIRIQNQGKTSCRGSAGL